MNASSIILRNALFAAGLTEAIFLSGPDSRRHAVGIVLGELSSMPADGYAIPHGRDGLATLLSGAERIHWPRIDRRGLKGRMDAATRGMGLLFQDACARNVTTMALGVPEASVFGDLDLQISVALILGAADLFWRLSPRTQLNHVLIAVQEEPDFPLALLQNHKP